jgi:hypothetical protein
VQSFGISYYVILAAARVAYSSCRSGYVWAVSGARGASQVNRIRAKVKEKRIAFMSSRRGTVLLPLYRKFLHQLPVARRSLIAVGALFISNRFPANSPTASYVFT